MSLASFEGWMQGLDSNQRFQVYETREIGRFSTLQLECAETRICAGRYLINVVLPAFSAQFDH